MKNSFRNSSFESNPGKFWSTRFNVSLMLSDWAPNEGRLSQKNRDELEEFFQTPNSLARLTLRKRVSWTGFGEISEVKSSYNEKIKNI